MKEIGRKAMAVFLAVFMAAPALAWSGEVSAIDAGFSDVTAVQAGPASGSAGMESLPALDSGFRGLAPIAGLGAEFSSPLSAALPRHTQAPASAAISANGLVAAPLAEEAAPEAPAGADETGVGEEARRMHQDYEERAEGRIKELQREISAFRAGIFGLELLGRQTDRGVLYVIAVTVNGAPEPISAIEAKLASGAIPAVEKNNLEAAQKAIERFAKKLQDISRVNDQEHRLVHQRMEEIARAAVMRKIQERLTVGRELEGWGVPNKISVNLGAQAGLRYSNLYRMNGMPTDLGVALHKILSPLVSRDPAALSRITQGQLHEAIRLLADGRKYVMDPSSEDFQKLRRMGLISEGYAYPEWRDAFMNKAKEALESEPESGDKPFGLGVRPGSKHPSDILMNLLKQTVGRYNAALHASASQEEISSLRGLIEALSGATGLPVDLGAGPMTPGVQHRQLLPILEELQKSQTEEEVIKAVVRSFPLGESLYRLGVHRLWTKGLTGRGIKVAVIDNGVDFEHPDFSGVKSHSENLTRDRGWFTKGAHGTPMADIIHAIAPDAEIQSYQALSNAQLPGVRLSENETYEAVLKAMDRAKANGAQIISLSLGFPMGLANDPLTQKVAEFAKDGILVVVSAGNDGFDMPGNFQLRTPGTAPDAITVGATDYHGNKAFFSSAGQAMNPADYSLQDKPDIYAFGVNIKAAARLPKEVYAQEAVPYTDVSGTSPAAPHVSGLAALMVQAAQGSGIETSNARAVPAAKQALRAAARMVARLPVLDSAEKAVEAFVRLMSGGRA